MIIYQAQPNSRYPFMQSELACTFGVWNCFKMFNFNAQDRNYAIEHNLIDKDDFIQNPALVYARNNYDGICYSVAGYFAMSNSDKQPGDFSFTLLNHPVDNFYSFYYFCNILLKRLKSSLTNNRPLHKRDYLIMDFVESWGTQNEYVDKFINNNGILSINFENMIISVHPIMFKCSLFSQNHDFYGIVDTPQNEKNSLDKLSELLDVTPPFKLEGSIANTANNTYRRQEVEEILRDDIEFYQQKVEILRGGTGSYLGDIS